MPVIKLSRNNVRDIREQIKKGVSLQLLADEYNVSRTLIYKIKQWRVWRDVKPDKIESHESGQI